jgi:hypothetical protein
MRFKIIPNNNADVSLQIEDSQAKELTTKTPISELMEYWAVLTLNLERVHCRKTISHDERPETDPQICRTNLGTWQVYNSKCGYYLYRLPFYRINGEKHWTITQAEALLNEKGAFAFAEKHLPLDKQYNTLLAKAYQRFLQSKQPQFTAVEPKYTNVLYTLVSLGVCFHFIHDVPLHIGSDVEEYTLTEHHIQMQGNYYIVAVYSDLEAPKYYKAVIDGKGYVQRGELVVSPPKGLKLQVQKTPNYV